MKAHSTSDRRQASRPPIPDGGSARPLGTSSPASDERPRVRQLGALQAMMNGGAQVRRLEALGGLANRVVQRMPADGIRLGLWYEIKDVEGPRYLKSRRPPGSEATSWEFYSDPRGAAKGHPPLVITDPGSILRVVNAPPALAAEEFGKSASDGKIFGLDGKDKASVLEAIKAGYRAFDAAKTYDFSAADLVQACRESGLERHDYKVVYKVGHGSTPQSLDEVIQEALDSLGYIDVLMVHEATGGLAETIATINRYIARGLVKTGGLSNVTGFDLEGVEDEALRHMTVLQDPVTSVKAEREAGPDARARQRLESAGVKVTDSLYNIHGGIKFTAEDVRALEQLGVSEAQARTIWARHHGYGEVTSSSNADRIRQNLERPYVRPSIADAVAALIDRRLGEPEPTGSQGSGRTWNTAAFREIHRSALANAQSNNLDAFMIALGEINRDMMKNQLRRLPLKLQSSDVATQRVFAGITWKMLLDGDQSLGAACNKRDLLLAIAAAVEEMD